MSATTLETILNNILTTVYGKDVRQAIHDAIQQCYADATGNPESVAKLANDLSSYSQRLEETRTLIQQLNDSLINQETTLWSGDGSTAKNSSFALGDSVGNYDYIDIHVNFYGLNEIRRINVSKANDEFYRVLRFHNFADNAGDTSGAGTTTNTSGYAAMELYFTFKAKKATLTNSTYFAWSGTSTEDAKGRINLDDDANRRVAKIVGIKRFKGSSAGMNAQTKTVSPTFLSQSIIPDDGYNCLSQVTVEAIPTKETSNNTGTTMTIG